MSASNQAVPPGTMLLWAGGAGQYSTTNKRDIPGWLYCDGTTVSKATYPALYAVIGDRYNTGGEAVGTFRLPGVAGYMAKATNTSSNTEHVSSSANHNHTIVSTSGLGISAIGVGNTHNHGGISDNTSATHYDHSYGGPPWSGNAGNSGAASRGGGTAIVGIASHTHSANSGVNNNNNSTAGAHAVSANILGEANHTHSVAGITFSAAPGTPTSTTPVQPTIDLWHIIKI